MGFFNLNISFFYVRIKNFIIVVVDIMFDCKFMGLLVYVCCFVNVDEVEKYGFELMVSWVIIEVWEVNLGIVYM